MARAVSTPAARTRRAAGPARLSLFRLSGPATLVIPDEPVFAGFGDAGPEFLVSASAAGEPSKAAAPSRATGRVLVVEDDFVSARALRGILRHAGWEVDLAPTVGDALRLLANGPGWVILDLMLPDGDGEAVLRHLRATGSRVRVTVTTGIHDPPRLAALHQLRPDAVLQKPIDLTALLRTA